jgi:TetR/AcrR family transcriptional regulator, repressor of fatR-cypB operon
MITTSKKQLLSRKEREKISRQGDILNAARELFLSKGYHKTTLEEIARHADFGKGTIYNYFESKEELFRSIIDQFTDEIADLVQSSIAAPGGIREKLASYAKVIINYSNNNSDLFRFISQEIHRAEISEYQATVRHFHGKVKKINTLVARLIQGGIDSKKIRRIDPMMLAMLFDGMVRSYCMMHDGDRRLVADDEIDHVVSSIVSIFFDGAAETNFKG